MFLWQNRQNALSRKFSCRKCRLLFFSSWKTHAIVILVLVSEFFPPPQKNYRDKCFFFHFGAQQIFYITSLFFITLNCHISVQKLSNHLVVPWMSKRDHIFLQISESRYPDNPNITEFTFEGVTIHSLNLKLASTLIVLLFEVDDTDISILF